MPKFYVAKLNINENIFNQNLLDIKMNQIPNLFLSFTTDEKQKYYTDKSKKNDNGDPAKWTFTDVVRIKQDIFTGNLTKISTEREVFLDGANTHKDYSEKVYTSRFYYEIDKELIFLQSTSETPYDIFIDRFNRVLLTADANIQVGNIDIELLTKVDEFKEAVLNQTVRKFKLNFVTPNDPKTTGSILDILVDNNIKKADIKMENDKEGISTKNDKGEINDLFEGLFLILRKGFGSMQAWIGTKQKPKRVDSTNFPVTTKRLPISPDDKDHVASLIHKEVKRIGKEQE